MVFSFLGSRIVKYALSAPPSLLTQSTNRSCSSGVHRIRVLLGAGGADTLPVPVGVAGAPALLLADRWLSIWLSKLLLLGASIDGTFRDFGWNVNHHQESL